MKKYIILGIIILAVILGGGVFALFSALSGGPWEGVWWGVQEAGMNWSCLLYTSPSPRDA